MNLIQFDNGGFMTPADVLETNMETFEQVFIFNEHRRSIFQEYLLFLNSIQALGVKSFYQWLNGSFTTMKSLPNDLDVVTFLPADDFQKHEKFFEKLFLNRYSTRIDCYFIKTYPENHLNYIHFRASELDFWHNFTKTVKKQGRSEIKISKGFVKIVF